MVEQFALDIPGRRGRPSKLTPETQEAIVEALEKGASLYAAAAVAGIDPSTVRRWRKRGANGQPGRYAKFNKKVRIAIGSCEANLAFCAVQEGLTNPKMALRILTARFPQRWSPRRKPRPISEIKVRAQPRLSEQPTLSEQMAAKLTDEELRTYLALTEKMWSPVAAMPAVGSAAPPERT